MICIAGGDLRYVGLKNEVAYRIELGFAIVDDGNRLFRFQASVFEHIAVPADNAREEEQLLSLIREHPSIFCLFQSTEAAAASFADREV